MSPLKSYRIWFTQRSGSTLLCKGLEQTGIAGKPGEFFNLMDSASLCEQHQVQSYAELRDKFWELGSSSNAIFGIKHSLHASRYNKIVGEIKSLKGFAPEAEVDDEEALKDLFPNCKHIFLTRRNKIRQAVSWWKAIKDEVWHIAPDQEHQNEDSFYEQHYDFDALSHLYKETMLKECAIQEYFAKYQIQPLTLVYEDFIQDFAQFIQQIIDYLEIDYTSLKVEKMYFKKTANARSEKWVQRFRQDLQKEWTDKVW